MNRYNHHDTISFSFWSLVIVLGLIYMPNLFSWLILKIFPINIASKFRKLFFYFKFVIAIIFYNFIEIFNFLFNIFWKKDSCHKICFFNGLTQLSPPSALVCMQVARPVTLVACKKKNSKTWPKIFVICHSLSITEEFSFSPLFSFPTSYS